MSTAPPSKSTSLPCDPATCMISAPSDGIRREGLLDIGDICEVNASLEHPFLRLLVNHAPSVCTQQTRNRLNELESVCGDHGPLKKRPCLITSARPSGKGIGPIPGLHWDVDICLMGTFEGEQHENLSTFYKFFAVPVRPTAVGTFPDHLHTNPQWNSDRNPGSQYIIAYPIPLKIGNGTTLKRRWESRPNSGKPSTFCVDQAALKQWEVFCDKKLEQFQAMPTTFIDTIQAEVQAVRNARRTGAASQRSRASRRPPATPTIPRPRAAVSTMPNSVNRVAATLTHLVLK